MKQGKLAKKDLLFVIMVIAIVAYLAIMPDLYKSPYARLEERYVARVVETDNSLVRQYGIVKTGVQRLKVRILEGPWKGETFDASNYLTGKMELDKIFKNRDKVYVIMVEDDKGGLRVTAYDHYRLWVQALLIGFFTILLVIFAGRGGIRVMLSLIATLVFLWKIMFPAILKGNDPFWVAIGIVTTITGITLFLIAGVGRTALIAWTGTFMGIFLTALLAYFLFPVFRLHGAMQPFSETLLYSGFDQLDLSRLFITSVFIGASGAVADISIDVAAAMREVVRKRPEITKLELIGSGLSVGRAASGVMITTLLMAYMSGNIAFLMILVSRGIPAAQILNMNYVAAELLKVIVGGFGLITVVPFTAIIGGLLFKRGHGYEKFKP
ncbi:MAG TPA: YibE/F family protein [Syntrophorhabdaceae bacterium]|nr:YibE/F family protein [Syntrophorhabdaceae bacterium]